MNNRLPYLVSFFSLFLLSLQSFSQVGIGTTTPDVSAILDVTSTNKGFLVPRMTTAERLDIINQVSPDPIAEGLLVYDTDLQGFYFYKDSTWHTITQGSQYINLTSIGSIYMSSPTLTNIAAVNTPIKVAGTTSAGTMVDASMTGNNQLTYTGSSTNVFSYTVSLSLQASGNNKTFNFYIYKNGFQLVDSTQSLKIGSNSDVVPCSVTGTVELATNDYLEVWVENLTDDSDITVPYMNFLIR